MGKTKIRKIRYYRVRWLHLFTYEPEYIIAELDSKRNELRKIEIYKDGKYGYADKNNEHRKTRLAEVPWPDISTIYEDKQFVVEEISKLEFEQIWGKYVVDSCKMNVRDKK